MMTNDEMLAALKGTFPELDRWRMILASEPSRAAEGSDLAVTDQAWRWMPSSSLARLGLAAAREHLHAIRLLVEAREVFPSAFATLGRTALIGASMTVWMLKPDDPQERLRRSLAWASEDLKRHSQFGADVRKTPALMRPGADAEMTRLADRRDELAQLLQTMGGPYPINLTDDVIPKAIEVLPEAQRAQVQLLWRSMSGAGHVLMWHVFGQQGTSTQDIDHERIGRVTSGGDVEGLFMAYFPAFLLAAEGWTLLAQRSGTPSLKPKITAQVQMR